MLYLVHAVPPQTALPPPAGVATGVAESFRECVEVRHLSSIMHSHGSAVHASTPTQIVTLAIAIEPYVLDG
eukprot:6034220-Amphidinium_carterae.1